MAVEPVEYLRWAKTHPPARYELTASGVTPVTPAEFEFRAEDIGLDVVGAYGHPDLVDLIATTYGVGPEQVLPVLGTSSSNFIALAALAEPGRRVLVESPAYEPLLRVPRFLGLEVATFSRDANRGFRLDLNLVQRELLAGAQAVVLTDLHNPSGRLCPAEDLAALRSLCADHSACLLVDEVYRDFAHLNRGQPRSTAATLGPNVISTGSLTKVYGLGGLRAGWILASKELIEQCGRVMDHLSVVPPAPSTSLAIRAFKQLDRLASRTRTIYKRGFSVFSEWLASRVDLTDYGNDGATFAYLRLPGGFDADTFCRYLVEQHDTRVVPGSFFGQPDHIRIAFGLPPDRSSDLTEGLNRIGRALDEFGG